MSHYMGGEPVEDADDGCPGYWYRSPFAQSVRRYLRAYSGNGWNANRALDECTDPLVHDAVLAYENYYSRKESERVAKEWRTQLQNS